MDREYKAYYRSKIGVLEIIGTENEITSVDFVEEIKGEALEISPCVKECLRQIDEYFKGHRKVFDLNLKLTGTDFQKKVWNALLKIPYGTVVSYKDIARSAGNEKAARAVGSANRKNKISIIVPCHRVIGSSGDLVGYEGGLWRKEWLLKFERENIGSEMPQDIF